MLLFTRRPKAANVLLLIQWILWAKILSYAYKGVLLSQLATITYYGPLDTFEQMIQSDLPLYIPDVTLTGFLNNDPSELVNSLISKDNNVEIKFQDVFTEETTKK